MAGRVRWAELREELLARPKVKEEYDRLCHAFTLGQQIRALREAKGMSQQRLAEQIGSTQSAVARLEAGMFEPKLDTLRRVSEALEADLIVELRSRDVREPAEV
jgi:ribosome-binding protein aMBF1 (putative translation factor)